MLLLEQPLLLGQPDKSTLLVQHLVINHQLGGDLLFESLFALHRCNLLGLLSFASLLLRLRLKIDECLFVLLKPPGELFFLLFFLNSLLFQHLQSFIAKNVKFVNTHLIEIFVGFGLSEHTDGHLEDVNEMLDANDNHEVLQGRQLVVAPFFDDKVRSRL